MKRLVIALPLLTHLVFCKTEIVCRRINLAGTVDLHNDNLAHDTNRGPSLLVEGNHPLVQLSGFENGG